MIAEADVELSQTPVRLAFSRGGSLTVLDITADAIAFPGSARKPLKLAGLGGIQTIHVQFDGGDRVQLLCGGLVAEFAERNTTMTLREAEFAALPPLEHNILRNGGFTVLPGADGTQNTSAVKAVCATLFREESAAAQ